MRGKFRGHLKDKRDLPVGWGLIVVLPIHIVIRGLREIAPFTSPAQILTSDGHISIRVGF